jgi:hypothetical protein
MGVPADRMELLAQTMIAGRAAADNRPAHAGVRRGMGRLRTAVNPVLTVDYARFKIGLVMGRRTR